jgi:hypothetical protein
MLGVDDVIAYYARMVAMLADQRNSYGVATAHQGGPFFGLGPNEYDSALTELREELDKQVVLTLVASAEAAFRTDFGERVRRRTKDAVRPKLKALRDEHGDRVRLDDILGVWKDTCGAGADTFSLFGQILKHRHWLAHGRHWTDKSGVTSDPNSVAAVINDLCGRLRGVVPNFPLS